MTWLQFGGFKLFSQLYNAQKIPQYAPSMLNKLNAKFVHIEIMFFEQG